jgi:hypothetical protein
MSAAGAMACALPAALRVSAAGSTGMLHAWVALAAVGMGPMLLAVVVLRGAREGLRAFAGEGAALRAWGVGVWVALQFVVLALLGAVLRQNTHQHALAGVTYAFVALGVAAGAAVACARTVVILRASSPSVRKGLLVVLTGAVLLAVGAVSLRFVRAVWQDPMPSAAAATVVDVLAFALAALFSSRPSFARRRPIALLGTPVALAVALAGAPASRDAALRGVVDDRAPMFAPMVDIGSSEPASAP